MNISEWKKKEIFLRILNFFVVKISLICGEEGSC